MKNILTILIEAVVVAVVAVLFYYLVDVISTKAGYTNTLVNVGIATALVHIVFEYAGLNKYYVDNYYK
jgi:hypothetical protein